MTRRQPTRQPAPKNRRGEKLSVPQICEELGITRNTFYDWRKKGKAPDCLRMPNGELRVYRSDFDAWLESCEEAA